MKTSNSPNKPNKKQTQSAAAERLQQETRRCFLTPGLKRLAVVVDSY